MNRLLWPSVISLSLLATPAWGYLGALESLGQLTGNAKHIVVFAVDKVNRDKKVIIYKKVADLKGSHPGQEIKHVVAGGSDARTADAVLNWAEQGKVAIFFHNGAAAQTCIGHLWYECAATEAPWWTMTRGRFEQSFTYVGSASKLRQHVSGILAGKEVTVTALNHHELVAYRFVGTRDLPRSSKYPVWRIKAGLAIGNWPQDGLPGPGDGSAVPALVEALRNNDPQLRMEAAHELGWIGPPAKTAVPVLNKALQDPESLVRVRAAEALAQIDPDNQAALPALMAALRDEESRVRKAAADALGNIGSAAKLAAEPLGRALRDPDPRVRGSAAEALGQIGPKAAAAVPGLVEALKDPALRNAAAGALGAIGPAARTAVPTLAAALKDPDGVFRWTVVGVLARIGGPGSKAAVPLLVEAIADRTDGDKHCYQALTLLEFIGREGKEAAPAVIAGIKTGRFQRGWAMTTLANIDPQSAMPLLIADLKGADVVLRKYAAAYLGFSGRPAKDALPPLALAAKENSDTDILRILAWAQELVRGNYKTAVPLLIRGVNEPNGQGLLYNHHFCSEALERLGPEASEAVPVFIDSLQEKNRKARRLAASTLGQIGPAAKAAVPALRRLLQDEDRAVRAAAAGALEKIQDMAPSAGLR